MVDVGALAASCRERRFDDVAELWTDSYDELKQLARTQLRRRLQSATVSTTDLLHEAFLRLERSPTDAKERSEFLAVCSTVMRCLLIDEIRRRAAVRHGGDQQRTTLDTRRMVAPEWSEGLSRVEVMDLESALERMERTVPPLVHLVEMKFFGGMTNAEIAEALGVSLSTVKRDWLKARTILHSLLRQSTEGPASGGTVGREAEEGREGEGAGIS